jgi:hypothetical protein
MPCVYGKRRAGGGRHRSRMGKEEGEEGSVSRLRSLWAVAAAQGPGCPGGCHNPSAVAAMAPVECTRAAAFICSIVEPSLPIPPSSAVRSPANQLHRLLACLQMRSTRGALGDVGGGSGGGKAAQLGLPGEPFTFESHARSRGVRVTTATLSGARLAAGSHVGTPASVLPPCAPGWRLALGLSHPLPAALLDPVGLPASQPGW